MPHVFDTRQRDELFRAAASAEELTADFYCIPGREWARFPYEVATLADGPGPRATVFADVVRAARPGSVELDPYRYRIRIRDDECLAAAGPDRGLFPLLLYVLTHELIHVVRFASGTAPYDPPDPETRDREEQRVHALTRKVLRPARGRRLDRVVDDFFA